MFIFWKFLFSDAEGFCNKLLLCWCFLGRSSILSFVSLKHLQFLLGLSLLSPLPRLLNSVTTSLSLLLVNEFHENSLVLEHITLSFKVQLMVQVTIDLLSLPVSLKKPPKNSHSSNPQSFLTGSGILGTLPLTKATVTTLAT